MPAPWGLRSGWVSLLSEVSPNCRVWLLIISLLPTLITLSLCIDPSFSHLKCLLPTTHFSTVPKKGPLRYNSNATLSVEIFLNASSRIQCLFFCFVPLLIRMSFSLCIVDSSSNVCIMDSSLNVFFFFQGGLWVYYLYSFLCYHGVWYKHISHTENTWIEINSYGHGFLASSFLTCCSIWPVFG